MRLGEHTCWEIAKPLADRELVGWAALGSDKPNDMIEPLMPMQALGSFGSVFTCFKTPVVNGRRDSAPGPTLEIFG